MKAIQLRSPGLDHLDLAELPEPGSPGPGEIRVRLRASTLNYHDYIVVTGGIPTASNRVPMSDGAGEVLAIGPGVTGFVAGDTVVSTFFTDWLDGSCPDTAFAGVPGDGIDGYAREMVTAPATWFTSAPKGYSPMEAAALTCAGVTVWRGLVVNAGLKAGDVVLTQGTGGVSIFALQLAKAFGATVIATSSSDEKLERLTAMGADHVINYKSQPKWGGAVRALTGGRGADCVVEIGGAGTLPQSITATRVGGHISLIGVLAGFSGPIATASIMQRQLRVVGVTVGSRRDQLDLIRAIDATNIKPVIDKVFPLAALADAFRYQETGAHFGKIGIEI